MEQRAEYTFAGVESLTVFALFSHRNARGAASTPQARKLLSTRGTCDSLIERHFVRTYSLTVNHTACHNRVSKQIHGLDVNRERQKEEFSNAFIQAASAAAGLAATKPAVDDDSVDWIISEAGGNGALRSSKLELQLKCTATPDFRDGVLRYPLAAKNYGDLIPKNVMVPRILVVVAVPADVSSWLTMSEASLTLRNCAYWLSLRGAPESDNERSKTVHIPITQRFDADALRDIFQRIANGVLP